MAGRFSATIPIHAARVGCDEEVYRRASEYIIENCATDEEIEDLDPSYDLFGKYCTDEILLHSFEELINNNPVIYRGVRFEEKE